MIFAIDFDGTIVKDAYPEIGKLDGLAEYFIKDLKGRRHTFILWTNRSGERVTARSFWQRRSSRTVRTD